MKDKSRIFIDELINRFPPLESCDEQIGNAIDMILNAVIHKKKILVCGNGGSASDAMHIVGELMKSFNQKRDLVTEKKEKLKELYPMDAEYLIDNLQEAIPAISLVGETSLITAFSNDQAADLVFAQQVLGLGNEGDVLWAISTSGNSENVLYACKVARIKGMKTFSEFP
ncbi:D-sedoheptulose-7-phosphate isomerase, partial [Aminipila sp.]|uniref:D-sedoheptulose-7-phosphate isomerase n=1 Tax=Aminipila sp. TaxID=2060095 RepID=UPI00289C71CE